MRVLKAMRKKLKSNRGFTLVEMLVALAIVVMLSLMMSVGSSVGAQVQRESTFVAQSDILASTINTALGDVLRYATVKPVSGAPEGTDPSVEQALAAATLLQNEDDVTCLISNDGYGIRNAAVVLDNAKDSPRLAVKQVEKEGDDPTDAVDVEKVYYLVSHGVYTNLKLCNDTDYPFTLTYIEDGGKKYFHANYWIMEKNSSKPLKKEVDMYFRVSNE